MPNPSNRFHLWIYRARADVTCVVHTHPPYVSALSMIGVPLIASHMDTAMFYEDCAWLPEWPGPPIGDDEGDLISTALGDKRSILLAHHGQLSAGETVEQVRFEPGRLMELLDLIDAGTLSTGMAKTVFEEMFETGAPPKRIAEERGLVQISDAGTVRPAVEEAVSGNPGPVADYLAGKEVAIKFLVGQVMKITRGKANPQLVAEMLKDKLESMRQTGG